MPVQRERDPLPLQNCKFFSPVITFDNGPVIIYGLFKWSSVQSCAHRCNSLNQSRNVQTSIALGAGQQLMRQKYFLIRQKQRSVAHEKLLSGWYCTRSFRSCKAKAIWHHEIKQMPFPCMPLFTPLILILSCLTSLLLLCIFSMIINFTSNSPIAFSCEIFHKTI